MKTTIVATDERSTATKGSSRKESPEDGKKDYQIDICC